MQPFTKNFYEKPCSYGNSLTATLYDKLNIPSGMVVTGNKRGYITGDQFRDFVTQVFDRDPKLVVLDKASLHWSTPMKRFYDEQNIPTLGDMQSPAWQKMGELDAHPC